MPVSLFALIRFERDMFFLQSGQEKGCVRVNMDPHKNPIIVKFFNDQSKDKAANRAIALRQSHNDLVDLVKNINKAILKTDQIMQTETITFKGKDRNALPMDFGVYLLEDHRLVRRVTDKNENTTIKSIPLKHFKKMPAKPKKSLKKSLLKLATVILLKAKQFGLPKNEVSAWERQLDGFLH